MGRWSAAHWKTATFGWLAFVLVAFALGGAVGMKTIDPNEPGPGESGRMDRILEAGFKQPAGESVLIQSSSLRASDPAFRAAVAGRRRRHLRAERRSERPLAARARQRGPDRAERACGARRVRDPRRRRTRPPTRSARSLDRVDEVQKAHPQLFIGEFGDASAVDAVDTVFAEDLEKAGLLSLPITLIILVVAFGALVAAGIPLLLALTAVFATFGLIALRQPGDAGRRGSRARWCS